MPIKPGDRFGPYEIRAVAEDFQELRDSGHPANSMLTREIVAKTALGVGLDESPRWG